MNVPGAGSEKPAVLYAAQIHKLQIHPPNEYLVSRLFSFLHFRLHFSSLDLKHSTSLSLVYLTFLISGFHLVTLVGRYHFIIYLRTGKSTGFWSEPCCPGEPRPHLIATGDFSLMIGVEFEAAINSEPSAIIISCRGFDHGRLVPSIFHLLGPTCHHKGKLVSKQVPAKPRGI